MKKIGIVAAHFAHMYITANTSITEKTEIVETNTRFEISEYKTRNSVRDYKDGRANRRERRAKNRKK